MSTQSDGYLGNALVKRDGLKQNFTEEQVEEYVKCMEDPLYFASKCIKVIAPSKGLINLAILASLINLDIL